MKVKASESGCFEESSEWGRDEAGRPVRRYFSDFNEKH